MDESGSGRARVGRTPAWTCPSPLSPQPRPRTSPASDPAGRSAAEAL